MRGEAVPLRERFDDSVDPSELSLTPKIGSFLLAKKIPKAERTDAGKMANRS
jgi:hypothetical protein